MAHVGEVAAARWGTAPMKRRDGSGPVRSNTIAVRLDPVELDCIDYLAQEPSLTGRRGVITRSEVLRILVRERIDQVLAGAKMTRDQIAKHLERERQTR